MGRHRLLHPKGSTTCMECFLASIRTRRPAAEPKKQKSTSCKDQKACQQASYSLNLNSLVAPLIPPIIVGWHGRERERERTPVVVSYLIQITLFKQVFIIAHVSANRGHCPEACPFSDLKSYYVLSPGNRSI